MIGLRIVAPLLLLAACGGGAGGGDAGGGTGGPGRPGGETSTSPSSGPAISLTRTGGFAGVGDEVQVAGDGTWSATDRAGGRRTGRLSGEQHAELARLATDPGLAAEAGRAREPTRCADTYAYVVTVGTVRVGFVDCPTDEDPPPVAAAIVRLVSRAAWG